ncbi:integrin alpha-IIb isoform X2 [Paramormyrops kingsleyae]|uniref:Integrin, alpha 2b n=1 Tax=Paramormyrops kingsleyae TaxID=1676925 RepID=A0A3B3QZP2_9TELE|nr:integrin alpha-IIb-like isoform X2 [Paramormyrops kingsleyae]
MKRTKNHLLLLVCLVFSTFPHFASALNLDAENVDVYSGPEGSYFGFSVDFYKDENNLVSLVVGAPKANTSQPGVTEGGAVFHCLWSQGNSTCDRMAFDGEGSENYSYSSYRIEASKSHQWFGASVRVAPGYVLACAPLYHWNVKENKNESGSTPVGNCQMLDVQSGKLTEYAPCKDLLIDRVYEERNFYHDRRYCEAGFSSDITKDGKVVLGAPGGYYFEGQIIAADVPHVIKSSQTSNPVRYVENTVLSPEMGNYDVYKGYSVAVGEFTGDSIPDYVVGAPNDQNTVGSVKIYNGNTRYSLQMSHTFYGTQVASYFGHAVAVTDINNDGRDDILVGVPLFMQWQSSKQLLEVGQVLVYLQKERSTFSSKPDQKLIGADAYGRFGSAVAPLGDIDQDGFNDIAVGAPFSHGEGRVFIFMGQADGLLSQHPQVLQSPFQNLPTPAAFGFTLRGATDIDANGYPDLAVGAWGASKIAVYRAQAVVRAKALISLHPDFLNPDVKLCQLPATSRDVSCFTIQMCVSVSGHRIPEQIVLNAELQLDKMKQKTARRTLFLKSSQPQENLSLNILKRVGVACMNHTAYLRHESEFKDKLSPIFIALTYRLANSTQAVLQGHMSAVAQTRIILDCGEDNVCVPDLRLAAKAENDRLLIGDENPALLLIDAENRGEGAYETELQIHPPPHTHYQGGLSSREGFSRLMCSQKKDNGTVVVICDLGNPMRQGQKVQAGLYFSVGNLGDVDSHVSFQIQIKSKNSLNPDSNLVDLPLTVSAVATLEMRGGSSPAECVLPIANWKPAPQPQTLEGVGPLVEHVYELRNLGPATVNARVRVDFPTRLQGKFLLYVFANASEESLTCHTNAADIDPYNLVKDNAFNITTARIHRIDKRAAEEAEPLREETVHVNCSGNDVCLSFVCEAKGLEMGGSAVVKVMSRLWVQTFLERPYEVFVLHSKAYYELESMPSKIQSEVHLSGQSETHTKVVWRTPDGEKKVPVWWIVVAIIAGLLLLALLNFILWKIGFFKRIRPPSDNDDVNELDAEQREYLVEQQRTSTDI